MKFEDLQGLVLLWADERNILSESDSGIQLLKCAEEFGELAGAVLRGKREKVIDGFGDMLVTLIIAARLENIDIVHCLEYAYRQIKDRKGRIINGNFVKENADE